MAYFSQINTLLNNQKEPRKSDALLAPQGTEEAPQGSSSAGPLSITAPSTAISSAAGNKSEQGQAASDYTKVNPMGKGVAASKILEANKGQQSADVSAYGGNAIAESQKALQNAANQYKTDYTYANQTDDDRLNKAADGDKNEFAKIGSLLTSAPKQLNNFAYTNTPDQNNESYVKGLATQEGRQLALKQQNQDSDYGSTAAEIDATLLGQSKGFRDQQKSLVEQYSAYDKQKADAVAQGSVLKNAYGVAEEAEKKRVKDRLGELSRGVWGDVSAATVAEQVRIDAEVAKATQQAGTLDVNKYLTGNRTATNAAVATDAQRGKFNRINELLNTQDRLGTEGDRFGVNWDGLSGELAKAQAERALIEEQTKLAAEKARAFNESENIRVAAEKEEAFNKSQTPAGAVEAAANGAGEYAKEAAKEMAKDPLLNPYLDPTKMKPSDLLNSPVVNPMRNPTLNPIPLTQAIGKALMRWKRR